MRPLRISSTHIHSRMAHRLLPTSRRLARCIRISHPDNSNSLPPNILLLDIRPNPSKPLQLRHMEARLHPSHRNRLLNPTPLQLQQHSRSDPVAYRPLPTSRNAPRLAPLRSMRCRCSRCTWGTQVLMARHCRMERRHRDRTPVRFLRRWTISFPEQRNKPMRQPARRQRPSPPKRSLPRKTKPSK